MIALALLLSCLCAAAPDNPAAVRKAIQADRDHDAAWLKSDPQSYLASVARVDFGDKTTLTVGASGDNDVRLPGLLSHHLEVTADAEGFRVEALDAGATFTVDTSTRAVREAALGPASLGVGRFRLRLSHQGFPAIIVFDPRSPRFKEYHGMRYFPIDLSYRFVARLIPDPKAQTMTIQSTHSAARKAERVGWFELTIRGQRVRLAATRLLEPGAGPDELGILFRDATTGHESYPVGRYVDPEKRPDGSYVIDFNEAFNPACAFSDFYNCPIPPKENYLTVAIRAGAKDPLYHRKK